MSAIGHGLSRIQAVPCPRTLKAPTTYDRNVGWNRTVSSLLSHCSVHKISTVKTHVGLKWLDMLNWFVFTTCVWLGVPHFLARSRFGLHDVSRVRRLHAAGHFCCHSCLTITTNGLPVGIVVLVAAVAF